MGYSFGWKATFLDGPREVVATKPGRSDRVRLRWDPPFLKRIDNKTGAPANDSYRALHPTVMDELKATCRERWKNDE